MKSFVKDLTDHFEISQENTKVSVISYASFSTLHFPFSQQFPNREALHSAIDNIPYSGGGTNTAKALVQAYSEMFNSNNGARLSGLLVFFFASAKMKENKENYTWCTHAVYFRSCRVLTKLQVFIGMQSRRCMISLVGSNSQVR